MDEDLRGLLEENLKISKEIQEIAVKTKRYLFWGQFLGWLKFFLVVVPVIIAIFYAVPFLRSAIEVYKNVMDNLGTTGLPADATSDVIKRLLTK
jgi:hypothetical protein